MAVTSKEFVERWQKYRASGGKWTLIGKIMDDACERIKQLDRRFSLPVVCICGSTRFKQAYIAENARLTTEGNIVLTVGLWGHHERVKPIPKQKQSLDELHKRKIDLCDWVWVLDVNGYIGDSTCSEIKYAESLQKPVRYLSSEFPDYKEPVDHLEQAEAIEKIHTDQIGAMAGQIEQQQKCIRELYHAIKVSPNNFPTKAGTCDCKSCVNWHKIKSEAIAKAEELIK